jgi:RNA polymerase sigma-70 factor (ECF subfamily)
MSAVAANRQPTQELDPSTWVDQHGDYLYRFALLRLRDPSLAEEAVQETFVSALQTMSSFAGHSSLRTWLVGILKHKVIDHFRRISKEAPAPDAEEALLEHPELFQQAGEWPDHWDFEAGPIDWQSNPGNVLYQKQFWETFHCCLSTLPVRIAQAFSLREIDELGTEEICKVLSVSATNLWVMLHRARAHLRHCLETRWFRATQKAEK